MKNTTLVILSLIFISSFASGQLAPEEVIKIESITSEIEKEPKPIPGSHLLRDREQKILESLEQNPSINRLKKHRSVEWNFSVGDAHTWWSDSLRADGQFEVPSTCRAVGTNCYIFVEDAAWGTDRVNQTAVDAVANSFDNSTPAFPNKGIYQVDTETFGAAPDVDNDPRIIILILDIRDGYSPGDGSYVAGYFFSAHQYPNGDPAIGDLNSNEAEIFFMDSNPADLITDQTDVLNTTAHEFQHMIHWQHDPNESAFLNEGLSEFAAYYCGYGARPGLYLEDTNVNLLIWNNTLADYSRAGHWITYIYEQFPIEIMKDFVNNSYSIWTDFDNTFRSYNATRGFFSVVEDWFIANYANGSSTDQRYTYDYSPLPKPEAVAKYISNPNGEGSGTLEPLGVDYITFQGGSDLSITFSGDPQIKVKALKIGSLEIEEVTKGTAYQPGGFGSTFPEVTFLVYNQSPGASKNYSYDAAGTAVSATYELAYDDGIPERPLNLSKDDTTTVQFNGINGGILDSIKVGFLNSGRTFYGISKFRGDYRITGGPLGEPLVPFSRFSVPTSSSVLNPFDNWVTFDYSGQDIDATDDFIVYFVVGDDNQVPGLMADKKQDDGIYRSRTYTDGNWWILSPAPNATPTEIWRYFIRAYVRVGDATVAIDQNGIVTIPEKFSLEQNYPNPFNPSTTFEFATPKDGLVQFTIHDLLGREIYSESRNLLAGSYSFTWNGQNNLNQQVVSGVYFLKMQADGFTQTRKMSLLR